MQIQPSLEAGARSAADDPRSGTLLVLGVLLGAGMTIQVDGPVRLSVVDLVLPLALVVAAPWMRIHRWNSPPAAWLLLAIMGAGLFRVELLEGGASRWALVNKFVGLVLLIVLAVALSVFLQRQRFRVAFLRSWAVATAAQAVLGVAINVVDGQLAANPAVSYLYEGFGRYAGLFFDPNAFALNALIVTSLVLFGPAEVVPRSLTVRGSLALVLTWAIWLSESRSGLLGLVLLLAWAGFVLARASRSRSLSLGVLGLAAMVLASWPTITAMLADRFTDRPGVETRVQMIEYGLERFWSNPVAGIGLGSFVEEFGKQLHNTPVWLLTELGPFAVLAAALLVGWMARRIVRALRAERGSVVRAYGEVAMGGLVVSVVMSQAIDALYQRGVWALVALAALLGYWQEHNVGTRPLPDSPEPEGDSAGSSAGQGAARGTESRGSGF